MAAIMDKQLDHPLLARNQEGYGRIGNDARRRRQRGETKPSTGQPRDPGVGTSSNPAGSKKI